MDGMIRRVCCLVGMPALALGLGLLVGSILTKPVRFEAERQMRSIDRDLLARYVRFVQSEYGLAWELGPCETLSRAQFKAFKRQTEWCEIREGGKKRERQPSAVAATP